MDFPSPFYNLFGGTKIMSGEFVPEARSEAEPSGDKKGANPKRNSPLGSVISKKTAVHFWVLTG